MLDRSRVPLGKNKLYFSHANKEGLQDSFFFRSGSFFWDPCPRYMDILEAPYPGYPRKEPFGITGYSMSLLIEKVGEIPLFP